jgi:hypothetical protein
MRPYTTARDTPCGGRQQRDVRLDLGHHVLTTKLGKQLRGPAIRDVRYDVCMLVLLYTDPDPQISFGLPDIIRFSSFCRKHMSLIYIYTLGQFIHGQG